ncbi:MAG: Glucose-6-phosphate 1-dehydrogenase [Chlamydiae bacterium]|nr:Glucose-6-phosphate 1-dehydrogenase [Chlamydiota bacterium]
MIKVYNEESDQASVEKPKDPHLFILFGASGDLTKRLLMPAVYNLAFHEALPDHFNILGLAKDQMDDAGFRDKISKDLQEFGKRKFDQSLYEKLGPNLYYQQGDFDNPQLYEDLKKKIEEFDKKCNAKVVVTYYLAVSPAIFQMISNHLGEAGLSKLENRTTRLILEKPFGRDLKSALELNQSLHQHWAEDQIWRIDHYLGKETVQNLLAFRFGNGIFEPVWNRKYIDHVQITVAEEVGVEKRGDYYDKAGALRDMFQNHILQILSYLCMEAPGSFSANAIRNCKISVLESITPLTEEEVAKQTVRGQYGPGKVKDKDAIAYRDEENVDKQSNTETFCAFKIFVDNWRWAGVPFYIRTGKHLKEKVGKVIIHFKAAPKRLFKIPKTDEVLTNELRFFLQPKQAITLLLKAKIPGTKMSLQPVKMHFDYSESFDTQEGGTSTGYEILLYDAMMNDPTLFSRSDLVERAWEITQPILDHWSKNPPADFPNYASGSWGPDAAYKLIENDGHKWRD